MAADGGPAVFRVGVNSYGFLGNPGIKLGMVEDLIMEFDEVPDRATDTLDELRSLQVSLEDDLVPIMNGCSRRSNVWGDASWLKNSSS